MQGAISVCAVGRKTNTQSRRNRESWSWKPFCCLNARNFHSVDKFIKVLNNPHFFIFWWENRKQMQRFIETCKHTGKYSTRGKMVELQPQTITEPPSCFIDSYRLSLMIIWTKNVLFGFIGQSEQVILIFVPVLVQFSTSPQPFLPISLPFEWLLGSHHSS